jgi:zinc D-Ala-D-Ala dipeptidase
VPRSALAVLALALTLALPACHGGALVQRAAFPPAAVVAPPVDPAATRAADLVEVVALDPSLRLDVRYATPQNFVGRPVYDQARVFLQRPAAEAVVRAHRKLAAHGYGLLLFDGYRPWRVTKLFWDVTPPERRAFVADPAVGSRHNRGCAIDLTLFDIETGREVEMPSAYDEMSEAAHPGYAGGTAGQRQARDLLRAALEAEGFRVLDNEWWHFDFESWREYPILDVPFEDLSMPTRPMGSATRRGRSWVLRPGPETARNPGDCALR